MLGRGRPRWARPRADRVRRMVRAHPSARGRAIPGHHRAVPHVLHRHRHQPVADDRAVPLFALAGRSSPSTQAFLLIGTVFLLPVILMYTTWVLLGVPRQGSGRDRISLSRSGRRPRRACAGGAGDGLRVAQIRLTYVGLTIIEPSRHIFVLSGLILPMSGDGDFTWSPSLLSFLTGSRT